MSKWGLWWVKIRHNNMMMKFQTVARFSFDYLSNRCAMSLKCRVQHVGNVPGCITVQHRGATSRCSTTVLYHGAPRCTSSLHSMSRVVGCGAPRSIVLHCCNLIGWNLKNDNIGFLSSLYSGWRCRLSFAESYSAKVTPDHGFLILVILSGINLPPPPIRPVVVK